MLLFYESNSGLDKMLQLMSVKGSMIYLGLRQHPEPLVIIVQMAKTSCYS